MSNSAANGGGVNSQVFNTDLLNTYTDSIGGGLLSFPDLNSGILSPLNSVSLSLSIVFGLFILGVFIIMKTKPEFGSQFTKLPGLGGLSHLKGKSWKSFFISFGIISILSYIFLGLYSGTGKYATGDGLRGFFMSNQEVYGEIGNEEKDGGGLVTVTLKPLEGIRITGTRFVNGEEDKNTINNETSNNSIIHQGKVGKTKCNYQGLNEIDYQGLTNKEDCVYPGIKQGMLIVDSFSTQGNSEKLNPVQLYVTNDYDGVNKRSQGGSSITYNAMDSINMQNSKHGIISILRNQSTISSEYGNDNEFLNSVKNVIEDTKSILYNGLGRTLAGGFSQTVRNTENGIVHIQKQFKEIKNDINTGINTQTILNKIDSLSNYNLTVLGYYDEDPTPDHSSIHDYLINQEKGVLWSAVDDNYKRIIERADHIFKADKNNVITIDRILFGEFVDGTKGIKNLIKSYNKDRFREVTAPLGRWMEEFKDKAEQSSYTIKDLRDLVSSGNKKGAIDVINKMTGMYNFGEGYNRQFLGFTDLYLGSFLTSIDASLGLRHVQGMKFAADAGDGVDQGVTNALLIKTGPVSNFLIGMSSDNLITGVNSGSFKININAASRKFFPGTMNFVLNDQDISKRLQNNIMALFEESSTEKGETTLDYLTNFFGVNVKYTPNEISEGYNKIVLVLRGIELNLNKKKIELNESRGDGQDGIHSSEYIVQLNDEFIKLMTDNGKLDISKDLLDKNTYFVDIVNEFKGGEVKYLGVANNKTATSNNDKSNLYGVWDNQGRIEKNQQNFLVSVIMNALKSDNDVTFVGVKGGSGIEVRKGDIIMGSPGTTIFALPYPVKLLMTKQMAETIEFIDKDGGTIGYYSDRYKNGELFSKGIGTSREVGKLTNKGLYGKIMSGLDGSGNSINWLFNPLIGFGVVESGFSRTLLIFVILILSLPAFVFFIFKNVALYFLTFLFFIFFIWLFTLDGQPKRVGKKVLAWFVSLSLIPLYGYLIMYIFWLLHGTDKTLIYEIRNFGSFYAGFVCLVVAYVPIMIFFGTKKFLFSLIVDGKIDTSGFTVGSFLGAGYMIPQRWGDAIDNSISKKISQGKDLANKGKEKISDSIGSKKKNESISTVGSLGDGKNDIANNELINRIVGKEKANEFDVNRVKEFDFNNYKKNEFDSHRKATNNLNQKGLRRNNRIEGLKKSRDEAQLRLEKLNNERRNQELKLMNNNTSTKEEKISGVTPELINSVNSIRKGMKSQGSTDRDFMRLLLAMFDQNKELLTNLTKALQEAQDKSSDPVIQGKLNNSNHTLTSKDLEIIKAIKEEKGIRGDITKEQLKKELNDTILKMKDGDFNHEYLDKIKAINSFNSVIHNDNQEEKFYAMTESISGILAEIKNRPGFGVEKEITKYIMNGDQQGLNLYKEQNSHIEGLDVLINKIQTMPHEMMRVLSSNASAAEMRNNAQGINEFIGLMKNSQQLEQLKHQDMNKYLSTMMQIQDFKNSTFEEKMNMASIASVQSIQSIKEANRVTTALSNEMSKIMQSQGSISQKSITNIVQNIAGTTEISVRDQRDLTNKLKENLNKIREVNK